jgi:hypothetical protein
MASPLVQLSYFIGSDIPPVQRYQRMLLGPDEADRQHTQAVRGAFREFREAERQIARMAYSLWEQAGSPPGRDREFWTAAERTLGAELLAASTLRSVHKRAL